MAERVGKTTGALQSELKIELHTNYAINLWVGRRRVKQNDENSVAARPPIMGMPGFLHQAARINSDSLKNNPWADKTMLALEEKLNEASTLMHEEIASLDKEMNVLPRGVTLTEAVAKEPLDIKVYSNSPLGYRCVYLLIGFDQLAKQVLQAFHYGLISRNRRDQLLQGNGRSLRQIYSIVLKYRSVPVSRIDAIEQNEAWQKACEALGEPDRDVLLGKKRSIFSPPIHEASVNLLLMHDKARATPTSTNR
ncbi:PFL_4669 family integrating conjugative element protein [Pectobacterium aroidearum]|uniref:PFL_4669 family integrating conjugative element protein n=1 Tax=Pectobacterium aroidearum TaxID=1201031 RepID=UPI0032EBDE10